MTDKSVFESSDSVRHAKPLKYAQHATFDGPFHLERGRHLPSVTVAYETYGTLNPAWDNAVLICHAISGDSHVAQHDEQDDPGWWDIAIGPGKAIDTNRYFVICPNVLGGCRGTTGPNSLNPATGQAYGPDFPLITIGDIVKLQKQLVNHLGIERLRAVVGGSLGGHMALTWATRYPEELAGCAAIATSPRLTSSDSRRCHFACHFGNLQTLYALTTAPLSRKSAQRHPLHKASLAHDYNLSLLIWLDNYSRNKAVIFS